MIERFSSIRLHASAGKRPTLAPWLLVLALAAMGGFWRVVADQRSDQRDALDAVLTRRPDLVRLTGVIVSAPEFDGGTPMASSSNQLAAVRDDSRTESAANAVRRVMWVVELQELVSNTRRERASGRMRLSASGSPRGPLPSIGDRVDVVGKLFPPPTAGNPGELDWSKLWRSRGWRGTLSVDDPAAVRVVGTSVDWTLAALRWRESWRSHLRSRFLELLGPEQGLLAQSLLIGVRAELPEEWKADFQASGLYHVLAISGLNVGLVWTLAFFAAVRLLRSTRSAQLAAMGAMLAYVALVDPNAPVLRAALMATTASVGRMVDRYACSLQLAGLAGLSLMAVWPDAVDDAGAQLSFLAVVAIAAATSWLAQPPTNSYETRSPFEIPPDLRGDQTAWERLRDMLWDGMRHIARHFGEAFVVTVAVCVASLPLLAARFQLVSPIGALCSVLFGLPGLALLACGYLWMALLWLPATLLAPLTFAFRTGLAWFLALTNVSAHVPGGHWRTSGPSDAWLVVHILFVMAAAYCVVCGVPGATSVWRSRLVRCWAAWPLCGMILATAAPPSLPDGQLRCTMLAVGHGGAALVECPNGRTLLYDAGALGEGRRAAETIARAARALGRRQLDVVALSHSDADHCNALPDLVDLIPIGSVLVAPGFLESAAPIAGRIAAVAEHHRIPLRRMAAGCKLTLGADVPLRCLHPADSFRSRSDNANSLVLEIEYVGRRILLTGDVEKEGLIELLKQPPRPVDVFQAPHHGSAGANIPALAAWSMPRVVLISRGGGRINIEGLHQVYGGCELFATNRHGAITTTIDRDGRISTVPFKAADGLW